MLAGSDCDKLNLLATVPKGLITSVLGGGGRALSNIGDTSSRRDFSNSRDAIYQQ